MVDFLGRDSAGGEEGSQARILERNVAGYLAHLQRGLDSLALIVAKFGLQFVDELAVACSRPPLVVAYPRGGRGIIWGGIVRLLGRRICISGMRVHVRKAGGVAHLTFSPIAIGAERTWTRAVGLCKENLQGGVDLRLRPHLTSPSKGA